MPNQLYHLIHSSPEIETVADLLNNKSSPAWLYNTEPDNFLNIVGEDSLTNRQRIESTFSISPEYKIYVGAAWDKLPLLVGTVLYLELSKINQPSFLTEGIEVVSNNDAAFKAAKLAAIEADPGYYQANKPVQGQYQSGGFQDIFPTATVWMWCRALSNTNDDSELQGEFIDLTPFIMSLNTSMTKTGGNFSLTLPPLVCELDTNNKWVIKKGTLDQYKTKNDASLQNDGYIAHSSIFTVEGNELVRNQMLFHNIIGSNDLVFIRMEALEMEKNQRYSDSQEYYINKTHIANRLYDMIGLVDYNNQSLNPANNDVSITISGRDLSKLFIEDGTFFYSLENSQGMLKFAGQSTEKNSLMSRIFADGALNFIGLYMFTSIEYILKFIIQQLSAIKVVPDDLFISYAKSRRIENGIETEYDSRNRRYTDSGTTGVSTKKRDDLRKEGIGKIEQLRSAAGTTNNVQEIEAKKKDEIFNALVNFLETVRKDHNRTTESNQTYGWKAFVYKGESLNKNEVPQYLSDCITNDKGEADYHTFSELINIADNYIDAGTLKKEFKEKLSSGIWQIVNLVVDKSVANRRLADSSFSTANGSLLNFIRSACQEPLVEYYADTYGDKYTMIVRRPPYDQKGLLSLINGGVRTNDSIDASVVVSIGRSMIVTIKQEDVLKESLSFNSEQVYSWYSFFPGMQCLEPLKTTPYLILVLYISLSLPIYGVQSPCSNPIVIHPMCHLKIIMRVELQ